MRKKAGVIFLCAVVLLTALLSGGIPVQAAEFKIDFETHCTALYLENIDTDTVVYQKNQDERRYPASTTKIMTYIIVAEKVADLKNTMVTVKSSIIHMLDGTGSSMAGLKAGEKLSVYQLLNCLMIPSGSISGLYRGRGYQSVCNADEPKGKGARLYAYTLCQSAWSE